MTRTLLAALALVLALASPSHAQTTRVQLSTTAWTDICVAPCSVKAINGTALFIIDTTPPTSLTQSPIPWNPENGLLPNMVTGAHVYGLAQSGNTAVSSIPSVASGGGSGGGGGGGPVTVADGADTTQGAKADTQATDDTSSWSVVAILKRISAALRGTLTVNGSGVTQPVSATSLPLPTGAATAANQNSTAAGTSSTTANGVQGVTGGVPLPVSGTFYQATQPVSATSLPLPAGAATAANQNVTAAGTTASSAQGVQGVTGGVPIPVSGSFYQATQPVSATSLPLPTGAATAANQVTMAANQNSTAAGTSASNAQGIQGVTGGVPLTSVAQDSYVPAGSPFSQSAAAILFIVDTTGYQSISVQTTGTFSATVAYDWSNDATNWFSAIGMQVNTGTSSGSASDVTPTIRSFAVMARYFRERVSSYTSGTVVATPILRSTNLSLAQSGVAVTNNPTIGAGTFSIGGLSAVSTANGLTGFSRLPSSAATNNLTAAKTSAGRAYIYQGCNTTASTIYMRLYNAASTGAVTVGTTTPFAGPYAFPANTCIQATPFAADIGIYASAGLVYAFGTAPADNDNTTIGAGAITAFQVGYQ